MRGFTSYVRLADALRVVPEDLGVREGSLVEVELY